MKKYTCLYFSHKIAIVIFMEAMGNLSPSDLHCYFYTLIPITCTVTDDIPQQKNSSGLYCYNSSRKKHPLIKITP